MEPDDPWWTEDFAVEYAMKAYGYTRTEAVALVRKFKQIHPESTMVVPLKHELH